MAARSASSAGGSAGGRSPRGTSPSSNRSNYTALTWEEDEKQKSGTAFEIEERDGADQPLLPYSLPEGWDDEGSGLYLARGPLSFVEANWFKILVGAVICINTVWLLVQSVFPYWRDRLWYLDPVFLAIYCLETGLRMGHWRLQFFSHPHEAGWNWFDLIIVLAGVLEEIETFSDDEKDGSGTGTQLMALRVFKPLRLVARLARFMRVVRLLRVLLTADFSWVESATFQSAVGVVILLNALIMGLETDIQSPIFEWAEQIMLSFFVLEAVLRVRHRGWEFFTSSEDGGWNILDMTIVASGVIDDWVLKAWSFITQSSHRGGGLSKLMTLARLLRLMRILRLVRVVRAIRPLYMLAIGVVRAMQSMFWVLVLTFVALYALAILTTRAIGRGELLNSMHDIPEETRLMFNTIADSMFTLFAFMNSQEWHKVAPLLNLMPWTKLMFVVFTIYSSWALLSVMTGVVSDHIQYVREVQESEDEVAHDVRQGNLVRTLSQIFAAADPDGSGRLRRELYMEILNSPFQVRRLQQTVKLHLEDIKQIFDLLDLDGNGTVDFEEFCESLDWISKAVTGRRLLKVELGVKLVSSKVQAGVADAKKSFMSLSRRLDRQHKVLMARFDEYQRADLGGPSLGYRRFRSVKSLSNISRASSTWSSFSNSGTMDNSPFSPNGDRDRADSSTSGGAEPVTVLGRPRGIHKQRSLDSNGLGVEFASEEDERRRSQLEGTAEEEVDDTKVGLELLVPDRPGYQKSRSFSFAEEGLGKGDPKMVAGLFANSCITQRPLLEDNDSDDSPRDQSPTAGKEKSKSNPMLRKSLSWGQTEEVG